MDSLTAACASRWLDSKVSYRDLTGGDVGLLATIVGRFLEKAGLDLVVSRVECVTKRDGSIESAQVAVSSEFLDNAPAVEFKGDGIVWVAGWFMGDGELLIAEAFLSWLDLMERQMAMGVGLARVADETCKERWRAKGARGDG